MTKRWGESGNIFFTLFGAVALVGVVGAATSTLMRGPVGTVVSLNQRAKADSQMQIAMKLAMLEAQQRDTTVGDPAPDCDADTLIEPMHPGPALPGLNGGGQLPSVGSTTNDPWGVAYGYCGWDHASIGGPTMGSGCADVGPPGQPLLDGVAGANGVVIAIISAGPDRTFGVTCVNAPAPGSAYITRGASGADDIIVEMTYAEANEASGGLWYLKSGNPDQITTGKELDVQQGAQFSSGNVDFSGSTITGSSEYAQDSRLDLGAGGFFMLPDETGLLDSDCDAATAATNVGSMRRDTAGGGQVLQICDPNDTDPTDQFWADIGGAGAVVAAAGDDGEIQFNMGGSGGTGGVMGSDPGLRFNSGGGLSASGDSVFGADVDVGDALTVDGAGDFNTTLNVDGATTMIGTLSVNGATNIDDTLGVTGDATFDGEIFASDGTSGAPAYSFTGATSSGIYYTSGGMGFSIGGTNEMTLSSSGLDVTALNVQGDADVGGDLTTNTLTVNDVINADRFLSDMSATSAALPGFQTEPGTGMFSAADNTLSLVAGGASRLVIDGTGDVGIGVSNPDAMLDVGGEIKVGTSLAACGATLHGAIRYVSGDLLQVCSSTTNSWESIGTSGGGGGGAGSYWTRISVADPRLYYTDDFVGVGTSDPLATFHVNGDFLTTGVYSGTASVPIAGAGTRMFFDPESGAFRAGRVSGTQWDDVNIGADSFAFGHNVTAGASSIALGQAITATNGSLSIGNDLVSSGQASAAFGNRASVTGDYSFVYGLGASGATYPVVSGTRSYGIFMGNQPNVDLQANNTMALLGGKMIIDQTPALNPVVSGTLSFDVEGDVGAVQYCDENGTDCFTAASVTSGGIGAPGLDREIIFNSNGVLGTDTNFVFTSAGYLGIGTNAPTVPLEVNGIVKFNSAVDLSATGIINAGNPAGQIDLQSYGFTVASFRNTGIDSSVGIGINRTYTPANGSSSFVDNSILTGVGVGQNYGLFINPTLSGYTNSGTYYGLSVNVPAMGGNAYAATFTGGNVGIGTAAPVSELDIAGTGAVALARGTTAERPGSPVNGMLRYNSTSGKFEGYQGGAWQDILTSAVAGGAAAPDRGIQFNSGGNFAADANFTYTAAGRVGIGTSAPQYPLHVSGSALVDGIFYISSDAPWGPSTWDNTTITSITGTRNYVSLNNNVRVPTSLSVGSPSFAIDLGSAALYVNGRVGIGTATPLADLDISGTNAILLPRGQTSNRPASPVNGMLRYNSVSGKFEGYQGDAWQDILTTGGGIIAINDLSDAIANYTSGNMYLGQGNGDNTTSGVANTSLGVNALDAVTTGIGNTAIGADVLRINTGGNYNAGLGFSALTGITSGTGNVALGAGAGDQITTGSNNIIIGYGIDAPVSTGDNQLNIGNLITGRMDTGLVEINGTGALTLPVGQTGDRPGPAVVTNGMLRYNSVSGKFEGYQGGAWQDILTTGGGTIAINDLTDAITNYTSGSMYLGSGVGASATGNNNTGLGYQALSTNTSGAGNTAYGWRSLYQNQTGLGNVALGSGTLSANTTSNYNTAVGSSALTANTTGSGSVAVGTSALLSNRTGTSNTAVGTNSLYFNSGGNNNAALGSGALYSNNAKHESTAIGFNAMQYADDTATGAVSYNTALGAYALRGSVTAAANTGTSNTALGHSALISNTSGSFGVAIGRSALIANTTGSDNIGIGAFTLTSNLDGYRNIALGSTTLDANVSGFGNVAVGYGALGASTSNSNTALGDSAGDNLTSGAYNIMIGSGVDAASATGSYQLNIGNLITGTTNAGLMTINGTGALTLPVGQTASRPVSPVNGMLRYNSTSGKFEGYQAGAWQDILTSAVAGGAAAPDRGIQFNSGGNFAASAGLTFSSTGRLGVGTSAPEYLIAVDGAASQIIGMNRVTTNDADGNNLTIRAGGGDEGSTDNAGGDLILSGGISTGTSGSQVSVHVARPNTGSGANDHTPQDIATFNYYGLGLRKDYGLAFNGLVWDNGQIAHREDGAGFGISMDDTVMSIWATPFNTAGSTMGAAVNAMTIDELANVALDSSGALTLNRGSTAQRPGTPVNGMIRYNSNTNKFEGYQAGAWQDILTSAVAGGAAAPDRGIQFNSGGNFAASSKFTWLDSSGTLQFTSGGSLTSSTISTSTPELVLEGTGDIHGAVRLRLQNRPGLNGALFENPALDLVDFGFLTSTSKELNIRVEGRNAYTIPGNGTNGEFQILDPNGGSGIYYARIGAVESIFYSSSVTMNGTASLKVPTGTTAQRPGAPVNGMIRYNSNTNKFEGYQADSWQDILTGAATSTFLSLTDTPASYAGEAGKFARVNTGETALEFTDEIIPSVTGPAPALPNLDDLGDVSASTPAGNDVIRFNSVSGLWETASIGSLVAGAAAPDRGIQFNSGGSFAASSNYTYTSAGMLQLRAMTDNSMLLTINNAVPTQALTLYNNSDNPRMRLYDENGLERVSFDTWAASGAYLGTYADAKGGGPSFEGAGVGIMLPNGSGNENGIYMGDGGVGNWGQSVATAVTFYDTDAGGFGTGGLRLKTNDGSGLTTRMQIDQQGLINFTSTGAIVLNSGTTAQRPTGVNGMLRYNSQTGKFEGYQAGAWADIVTGAATGSAFAPDRGIQFNSGGSFSASSNLVFTSANRMGIGTSTPQVMLDVAGEARFGNTNVTCTSDITGSIRYYSAGGRLEMCDGAAWVGIVQNQPSAVLTISPSTNNSMNVAYDGVNTPTLGSNYNFVVQNVGNINTSALTSTLTGDTGNFDIMSNTCTAAVLTPSATCTVTIRPKASGNNIFRATLSIPHHNAPTAALEGQGTGFGCAPGVQGGGGVYVSCGAYNLVALPAGCADDTSEPTCSGNDVVTRQWGSQGVQRGDATSSTNGPQNTVNLKMWVDLQGAGTHPAAEYCRAMVKNGFSDWYLPAVDEVTAMYNNRVALGGWAASAYWSSTQQSASNAYYENNGNNGKNSAYRVRCVRRETQALPPPQYDTTPDRQFLAPVMTTASNRVSSSAITITGISTAVAVTLSNDTSGGAAFRINGGAELTSGSVSPGDTLQLVMTAPGSAGNFNTVDVAIGGAAPVRWKVGVINAVGTRRVFAISSQGGLGGAGSVDSACQAAASGAGIGGTWKAIISDQASAGDFAANRLDFNWATLTNMNGDTVATGWSDLWDGSLANPINRDVNNNVLSTNIYTGSAASGLPYSVDSTNDCGSWTASNGYARVGSSTATGGAWLSSTSPGGTCATVLGFYCFENTTGGGGDTTPVAFELSPMTRQTTSGSRASSAIITITGINTATAIGVSGTSGSPKVKINGGAEVDNGTVNNGDTVQFVMTAPVTNGQRYKMDITVGTYSTVWYVAAADTGATKRIFATSTTYDSNLGGVAGADAKCQTRATAASLGGTWTALITDRTNPDNYAVNRTSVNWGTLVNMNSETVATSWNDLWDGSIVNAINRDEFNAVISTTMVAWTGTDGDGTSVVNTKDNDAYGWTVWNTSDVAYYGSTGSVSSSWANAGAGNYWSNHRRLYCIENSNFTPGASAPGTDKQVLFNDGGTMAGDSDFLWDRTLNGMTINGNLTFTSSGALSLNSGSTAERPSSPANGMLRYNSQTGKFEGYQAGAWQDIVTGAAGGSASAPDRGIQFNSGGSFAADANLTYTSVGTLIVQSPASSANLLSIRNSSGTQIGMLESQAGHGELQIYDASGVQRIRLATNQGSSAPYIDEWVGNKSTSTFYGAALSVRVANGLSNENGIYMGDSSAGNTGENASAAMVYYDTSGSFYGRGGLRFKTNNGGSGLTTRMQIDQNGVVSFESSGAFIINRGDTSQRPAAPENGMLRYNSQTGKFEGYQAGAWQDIVTGAAGGSASAPDRGIQFNSGGAFAADDNFTYQYAGFDPSLTLYDGTDSTYLSIQPGLTSAYIEVFQPGDDYRDLTLRTRDTIFEASGGSSMRYTSAGRLGIGTATPEATLDIAGTNAVLVPRGSTAQRPGTAVNGMIRYNSQTNKFEGYQGGTWADIITGAATSTFLSLTDTPSSYAGENGKYVRVNAGSTALEFTDQIVPSVAGQPAPTNTILDDLGDVVITSPTAGHTLFYSGGNWVNGAGSGSSSAAGATTQIQYNNAGAMAASSKFTWIDGTGTLQFTSGGSLTSNTISSSTSELILEETGDVFGAVRLRLQNRNGMNGALFENPALDLVDFGFLTSASKELNIRIEGRAGLPYTMTGNSTEGEFQVIDPDGNGGAPLYYARIGVEQASLVSNLVTMDGTGSLKIPSGSTAQRPASPVNGMIRYNSQTGKFEGYQAGAWADILTGAVSGLTFLSLTDTPASYAGNGGMFVKVNSGETALEFTNTLVNTVSGQPAPTGMSIDDLGDVTISSPTAGQTLFYSGGSWVNGTSSGGGGSINDLTDAITNYTSSNMYIGTGSGDDTTTAVDNTSLGHDALAVVTTGYANVAIGSGALESNVVGYGMVGIGHNALRSINGPAIGPNIGIGMFAMGNAVNPSSSSIGIGNTVLYNNTGANNIAIGDLALTENRAKGESTAIGYNAMRYADSTTTASVTYNTAIGAYALRGSATASANTGTSNTAIGHSALMNATTGSNNVAVGRSSLYNITTGLNNTAVGHSTMDGTGTGANNNTAFGAGTLRYTTGSGNTALGYNVLAGSGANANNTAVGTNALATTTTGTNNAALGFNALTTNIAKQESTAIGYEAMRYADNTATAAVTYNTALGAYALRGSTTASANTGINNTALGHSALLAATSGSSNVAVGYQAGDNITTGASNIIIGTGVDAPVATASNQLNVGDTLYGDMSDDRIGIGAVPAAGVELDVTGDIQYTGTITDVSDMRLKDNIVPLNKRGSMLDRLNQIGTYSFTMKDDEGGQVEFGVMAQEINKAFPELVRIDESTADKYMSVNYVGMIAPMIEATKELKAENEALKIELANLKADRETMATALNDLSRDVQGLKAHTGYGINKAAIGFGMVFGGIAMGGLMFVFFFIRNRQRKAG